MPHAFHLPVQLGELLDEHALTLEELAQACRRDPAWVSARLQAGVIEAQGPRAGVYYFTTWPEASRCALRRSMVRSLP